MAFMLDVAFPAAVRGPVDAEFGFDSAGDMAMFLLGSFLACGRWGFRRGKA